MMHQAMLLHALAAVAPRVAISNQTINDDLNLDCTYRLRNTGVADFFTEQQGSFDPIPGEWLVTGVVGDYEVRADLNSGDAVDVVGPALGTWGNPTLQVSTPGAGRRSELTFQIRDRVTQEVLDTAIIILDTVA